MCNKGLSLSPHITLLRVCCSQDEKCLHTHELHCFDSHLCLFLVSKQDIRITDAQIGKDTGFSSVPTSEIPSYLGDLSVSLRTFFLTGNYSL